jgi:hypothetical protein
MQTSVVELLHEIHVIGYVSYAIDSVLMNPTNRTDVARLDAAFIYFRIIKGNRSSRVK